MGGLHESRPDRPRQRNGYSQRKAADRFQKRGVTGNSLTAINNLEKEGLSVALVNIHSVKPFDKECVQKWSQKVKHVFTAEDHNIIGGLGGVVAEAMAEIGAPAKLHRIGVQDVYGESGTPEALYEKHGLDANGIGRTLKSILRNN